MIAGGEPALHFSSFNWCRPYLLLQPQNCFVLDDGNGRPVGYIIGVPDTKAYVQQYRKIYIPYLDTEGVHRPGPDESTEWKENLPNALKNIAHSPEGMLQKQWPDLLEQYPAHLHIDLLPSHQRRGFGRKMIDHFWKHLAQQGAKGLHLGMVATNEAAGKFYDRIGFGRYQQVLDDGESGELGRKDNTIIRVKKLD